jgi:prepilin-type N-terminal cleavage/methylation domain-containing protein
MESRRRRKGFTLVELLVVIAIIGILIALLLPAVQMAREAARRATCCKNIKQWSLAALTHESIHGYYPTGGWGWKWIGDPDRGFDQGQPGGFFYNILPYMEQKELHDRGAGRSLSAKMDCLTTLIRVPVDSYNCPSRRGGSETIRITLYGGKYYHNVNYGSGVPESAIDYAVNVGDFNSPPDGSEYDNICSSGPASYAQGDDPAYVWPTWLPQVTGVSFIRSKIKVADITDGTANTYLGGEKSVQPSHYYDGKSYGDDNNPFVGHDWDVMRWASSTYKLRPDYRADYHADYYFGSAHMTVCHMGFCDGSVHGVSYEIDPLVHARLGNRADGGAADMSQIVY